jgi:hypothetical protein
LEFFATKIVIVKVKISQKLKVESQKSKVESVEGQRAEGRGRERGAIERK